MWCDLLGLKNQEVKWEVLCQLREKKEKKNPIPPNLQRATPEPKNTKIIRNRNRKCT